MIMRSIGLRVTPTEVYYCIAEQKETGVKMLSVSKIKVPKALDDPCRLSYIRNTFNTIINQYNINMAGIKLIESNAQPKANKSTFFRLNLEGVLLELCANSSVEKYLLAVSSTIAALLGIKVKSVKDMAIDVGVTDELRTDDGKKLNDESKEAVVVAYAALIQR